MAEKDKRCKYCDTPIKYVDICHHCKEKLMLVRKMQAMIRNAKESGKKK